MTTARYLLCPGPVRSRVDGQEHHVGAGELARLYGLPHSACLVLPSSDPLRRWALEAVERGELAALHPRYDGDYRLPDHAPA